MNRIDELKERINDAEACYELAEIYYEGKDTKKNHREALKYYEMAAELGHLMAKRRVGYFYSVGYGIAEPDAARAFEIAKELAEKGVAAAQNDLAVYYALGKGCEKDNEKSFYYSSLSAEADYDVGHYNTAYDYHYGLGTEQNLDKAREHYEKAISLGYTRGYYGLYFLYMHESFPERNEERAVEFLRTGAQKGDFSSLKKLYDLTLQGSEDATELIKLGVMHDHEFFKYRLAEHHMNPSNKGTFDMKAALSAFNSINPNVTYKPVTNDLLVHATFNDTEGMRRISKFFTESDVNHIGVTLMEGKACPKNAEMGIECYKLALEINPKYVYPARNLFYTFSDAKSELYDARLAGKYFEAYMNADGLKGQDYTNIVIELHNGSPAVPKNKKLEFKYGKLGAKENERICYTCIGDIYTKGVAGIAEKDFDLGLEYLEKARDMDDSNACNMLGNIYLEGKDVKKDLNRAFDYFKRAIELNEHLTDAYLNLADLHYDAHRGKITLDSTDDHKAEAIKRYKKYVEVRTREGGALHFELHRDLNPMLEGDGDELDKLMRAARFLRAVNNISTTEKAEIESFKEKLEFLSGGGYNNASFVIARCYETGCHYKQDLAKAKEFYQKCHAASMLGATYRLATIENQLGNCEKAFEYLLEAATEYKSRKHGGKLTEALMTELESSVVGHAEAQSLLASLFEFSFGSKFYVKQTKNLSTAAFFHSYAAKSEIPRTEIEYLCFSLRNEKHAKASAVKRLLVRNHRRIGFAAAYEKALSLELLSEAEIIFRNTIATKNKALIEELLTTPLDEQKAAIASAALAELKGATPKLAQDHVYTAKYKAELKRREEEEKRKRAEQAAIKRAEEEKKREEEAKKKAEAEAEKKRLAEEKKAEEERARREEKERRAAEKQKREMKERDEYQRLRARLVPIQTLIQKRRLDEAVAELTKNGGELANAFPITYFIVRAMRGDQEIGYPNVKSPNAPVGYTGEKLIAHKRRYLINCLIEFWNAAFDCMLGRTSANAVSTIHKKYTPYFYDPSIRDFSTEINPISKTLRDALSTEGYVAKNMFLLAILSEINLGYNKIISIHRFGINHVKGQALEALYEIGAMLGSYHCKYNLYASEYKKAGLFNKAGKEAAIRKMKSISTYFYPAYVWCTKHKVEGIGPLLSYLKSLSYDYDGLIDFNPRKD